MIQARMTRPVKPLASAVSRKISVTRAARLIGCGKDTVYRLLEQGSIDGYQLVPNGWWYIDLGSVEAFVNRVRSSMAEQDT